MMGARAHLFNLLRTQMKAILIVAPRQHRHRYASSSRLEAHFKFEFSLRLAK
jgi:hypothetical protein